MNIDPALAALSRTVDMGVLGERLKTARVAAGLRQAELAEGIASATYVSRIEAGQRRPDLAMLVKFAERTNTSLEHLVNGGDADAPAELRLGIDHAELELRAGNAQNALAQLAKLEKKLTSSGDADLVADAAFVHALALEGVGDINAAIVALEDMQGVADPGGRSLRVAIALTRCYREGGDLGRSIAAGERALADSDALGVAGGVEAVQLSVTVAAAYFERGDVQHAVRLCQRAIERAEDLDSPTAKASAYWNASIMESEQGHVNAAIPLARHALFLLESADDNRNLARLHSQLGMFLLKADPPDPAGAIEVLQKADKELSWSGATAAERANNSVSLARAVLLNGDIDRAQELLDQVGASSDLTPMTAADVALLTGQVHGVRGQVDEARGNYQKAILHLSSVGADRRAAQLWFDLGALLQGVGDAELASDAYRRAAVATGLALPTTSRVVQT